MSVERLTKIKIKLYKRDLKRVLKKWKNFRTKTFCLSIFSGWFILSRARYFIDDISGRALYATSQIEVRSIGLGWRRTDVETEDSEFRFSIASYLGRKKIVAAITISVFNNGIYIATFTVAETETRVTAAYVSVCDRLLASSRGESIITKIELLSLSDKQRDYNFVIAYCLRKAKVSEQYCSDDNSSKKFTTSSMDLICCNFILKIYI